MTGFLFSLPLLLFLSFLFVCLFCLFVVVATVASFFSVNWLCCPEKWISRGVGLAESVPVKCHHRVAHASGGSSVSPWNVVDVGDMNWKHHAE